MTHIEIVAVGREVVVHSVGKGDVFFFSFFQNQPFNVNARVAMHEKSSL